MGSHISAGSCLSKAFLLLMAQDAGETKQPDSHLLTLGPLLVVVLVKFVSSQVRHSPQVLLPAWEGRAKPPHAAY